jgi:hypothetical protein
MKSKLLKSIRNNKRFTIEQRHTKPGFEHSGWWYLTDNKTKVEYRDKQLMVIIVSYVMAQRLLIKWRIITAVLLTCAGCILLFMFAGCQNVAIGEKNPYIYKYSQDSMSVFCDSITQP